MITTIRNPFQSREEYQVERKNVMRVARVLKILVTLTFLANIVVWFLVPVMVCLSPDRTLISMAEGMSYLLGWEKAPEGYFPFLLSFFGSWILVWTEAYSAVLALFLMLCGVCTAVILWQGRRVLDTILRGTPFCGENAGNLKRAAVCCFLISAFALARVLWGVWFFQSVRPLLTYCGLFVPIFLMSGLLCLVMSALFRQAAQIKAENDLTI